MSNKYSINVTWSDEDESFVATIPEFSLLSAFGETQEEALADAQVVLEMALDSQEEDNIEPPPPQVVDHHKYSGQVRLRMPEYQHRELAEGASKNSVSLNTYMVSLLAKVGAQEAVYQRVAEDMARLVESQSKSFSTMVMTIGERRGKPRTSVDSWASDYPPDHQEGYSNINRQLN